ncbi:hypothetical protein [Shinella sp.]|uniref:hypothetical protein n=1 Tax=Shinella sp. TaxID=1870904 RepID=UPI0039E50CB4
MGDILTFPRSPAAAHLALVSDGNKESDADGQRKNWLARQLSEAMASLSIAGADISEAQKLFHQQGTDPRAGVAVDTIESIVLALIPTIHLAGMSNRDRALYAALLHWLQDHQGGDHAC